MDKNWKLDKNGEKLKIEKNWQMVKEEEKYRSVDA